MIHFNLALNILVTVLSALGAFLQYHFLTLHFPQLTYEISNASGTSTFFGVFSLSLPFVISHLVSSEEHAPGSFKDALVISELYKKALYFIFLAAALVAAIFLVLSAPEFAILFILLVTNILLKNLLYSFLAFLNGSGRIIEENLLKLGAAVTLVGTAVFVTKYGYWIAPAAQIVIQLLLCQIALKKINQKWRPSRTNWRAVEKSTLISVRNHLLISIPGYFIFNLNILIAGQTLAAEHLRSLVKHIYLAQGFVTVIASSIRIIARNFNLFYLRGKREHMQMVVAFYFKVTVLFLPLALVCYYLFAPESLKHYFPLGEFLSFPMVLVFIAFVCIECYQVSLTGMSYAAGKTDYYLVTWISAAFGVALNFILIPQFGIAGAVAALAVSQQLTCNTFNFLKFKKYFPINVLFQRHLWTYWFLFALIAAAIPLAPANSLTFYLIAACLFLALIFSTYRELDLIKKVEA